MDAAKSVTPGAVSHILAHLSMGSDDAVPDLVVQVLDLKSIGTGSRFSFMATDGKDKIKAMLPTNFALEVHSGNLNNLGLIRILDYTCNLVKGNNDKVLIVVKCELVCQALDAEINGEAKKEDPPIVLKPKDEGVVVAEQANAPPLVMKPKQEVKSASQIVNEQRGKT
ncbi:replication protein A 70 kDa DNA-binding subunit B-like [Miscanthus floridulus]|uniref:replication protein A 70 kDa DNA-binding subunit B-like n=1 Tax=Miscanthus floridulus TaxID=154761 RepID=UPI003458732E